MNVLSDIEVCEQDVIDIISTLNVGKAVGHDIISNRMLLAVRNEITKPLPCYSIDRYKKCFFQISGKLHMSLLCLKRGNKSLPSNYRPVSLLSCVSKILEKIVYKQIYNHLHINKLLYKFQSRFQPGYSTTHQIIELYDNIVLALDKKQITSITFADISKTFDTVWIKALILKLENYGIKGKLLFWLKSYLSRRKQRVVIKDAISSTGELKAGVPQGSVLGPLLFLFFINSVADNMTGFGRLFADDTCIGYMAHNEDNLHTIISTDLEYLNAWSYR